MSKFAKIHSGEIFDKAPAPADNEFFYDCVFNKLNGAVLKNCKLFGSRFAMTRPKDIIGLTVTMDCDSFSNLELSPEVFDYLLLLMCRTKGNKQKRLDIIEKVVGHDRAFQLLKETELLENEG